MHQLTVCMVYTYVYIYLHIYHIYIYIYIYIYTFIWGFCSIVISVFVYAGRVDFRTENLSLDEFFFFSPQVRTNRTFVFQPIVQRSREREEMGGVGLDWSIANYPFIYFIYSANLKCSSTMYSSTYSPHVSHQSVNFQIYFCFIL